MTKVAAHPPKTPKTPKPAEPVVAPAAVSNPPELPAPEELSSPASNGLLSLEQLRTFTQTPSARERLAGLSAALCVGHYAVNPRSLVWVDLCFSVLTFALEEAQLSERKTLSLLRVANEVFAFATSPSPSAGDAYPTVEATYEVFRQLVRAHSVAAVASPPEHQHQHQLQLQLQLQPQQQDPEPELDALWTAADVARVVAFMSSTFFRHVAAYQHVFQWPRESLEREVALAVETPLPLPPLAQATLVISPE